MVDMDSTAPLAVTFSAYFEKTYISSTTLTVKTAKRGAITKVTVSKTRFAIATSNVHMCVCVCVSMCICVWMRRLQEKLPSKKNYVEAWGTTRSTQQWIRIDQFSGRRFS